MKLGRRHFLKLGLAQGIVLGAQTATATDTPPAVYIRRRKGPSVLQGATDESQTQFSIVYESTTNLQVQARSVEGEIIAPVFSETFEQANHADRVSKFYFSNLHSLDFYDLEILHSETGQVLDRRKFKTLRTDQEDLNFALCSCMNDENHDPQIWTTMVEKSPDVLFFIGDSVYADTGAPSGGATPAYLWKRFCEARRTLEIYYSPVLIPIIATWDDHDFGLNDSHSVNYKYVTESQKNFKMFFAQDPRFCRHLTEGPGVSTSFRWQEQLFLLMDDRSFRLPKKSKDRYAHWGQEQENWMLNQISLGSSISWILNGSQIFPAMPFKESMSENHPDQLYGVLKLLKELKTKVIFGTGDVHYSEVSKIEDSFLGYQTYELTSSSIHSRNIPGVPGIIPNDRRIAGSGKRNYLLMQLKTSSQGEGIRCDSVMANGSLAFTLNLSV